MVPALSDLGLAPSYASLPVAGPRRSFFFCGDTPALSPAVALQSCPNRAIGDAVACLALPCYAKHSPTQFSPAQSPALPCPALRCTALRCTALQCHVLSCPALPWRRLPSLPFLYAVLFPSCRTLICIHRWPDPRPVLAMALTLSLALTMAMQYPFISCLLQSCPCSAFTFFPPGAGKNPAL